MFVIPHSINNNKSEGGFMTEKMFFSYSSAICTDSAISISASLPILDPNDII